jgi:hypothetical protein
MSSSFITIDNEHGFWIDDAFMQIACWGLVEVIDKDSEFVLMKGNFRDHLFDNSQGIFVGFMHLDLETYLVDQVHIETFKKCIDKTKFFFLNKGDSLSTEELNSFQLNEQTKAEWTLPLKTKRIIKVLGFLEALVDGRLKYTGKDHIKYDF